MDDDIAVLENSHALSPRFVSERIDQTSPCGETLNSNSSCMTDSPSNRSIEYTCKKIEMLMKQQSDQYVVVPNNRGHSSKCWDLFGFPAMIESIDEQPKIIEKFVTCRKCFTTYSFISNSTRLLNIHICRTTPRPRSASLTTSLNSSSTLHQTSLTSYGTFTKTKIHDSQIKRIKDLQAHWVCRDIRPFTVVEDEGFRQLAQELIMIGAYFYRGSSVLLLAYGKRLKHVLRIRDRVFQSEW
jgi:hypothetical protein